MNKKLLLTLSVLAATGAMALAGCKGSGSGTATDTGDTTATGTTPTVPVDPISDIEVSEPSEDIVVGDVIDLDTLINVVGGSDPKGYEVTVRPVSADVVSVAGHTLTVLAEGPIELKVTAGDESALVSWESLSALKAQYKAATAGVEKDYGLRDVTISNTGAISLNNEILVHNSDYYYQVYKPSSSKTFVGEGAALLHDGFIYDFTTDGTEAAGNLEFTAEGKESGDMWEYYFVNMGFAATYDALETVSAELEDGSTVEYLTVPASAEVPASYEDYAGNLADYITLLTWGSSAELLASRQGVAIDPQSVYIEVEPLESTTGETSYLLSSYVEGTATGAYAGKTLYLGMSILDTDMHIQTVEDYIASETYPEPITVDEVTGFISALAAAKSYSQETVIGGFSRSGAFLPGSQLNLSCQEAYDGENKVYFSAMFSDTEFENLEEQVYYFEYDGAVYQVSFDEDGAPVAEELAGVSWATVENAVTVQTWANASTAGLVATSRTVNDGEGTVTVGCSDSGTYTFVKALVNAIPGYGQMFVGHMAGYEGNVGMTWIVASDLSEAEVDVDLPINYGNSDGIPTAFLSFYGLGETDLSELKARLVALVEAPEVSID